MQTFLTYSFLSKYTAYWKHIVQIMPLQLGDVQVWWQNSSK